jgi:CheY-like chemotaxis protein
MEGKRRTASAAAVAARFRHEIIERSIPFDLNGDAELSFGLLDVEARFVIPANYVQLMTTSTRERMKAKEEISPPRLSGTALIVEDNLIIAMSAEVILLELGARHAETAASVSEAMKAIERAKPSFALLDLNLGSKNSIAVGRKLKELKVPFIFATGYGERAPIPAELSDAPVIQKLYTRSLIESTLGKLKLG